MKKWLPSIILAIMALWVLSALRSPKETTGFNTSEFGRLPVLLNGRIQPIDSVARNALLSLYGKQSILLEERPWYQFHKRPRKLPAIQWLMEVMMDPDTADDRKAFRIDHPEVIGLLELPEREKFFSFNDLRPHIEEIEKQAKRIGEISAQSRTPFEKQMHKLHSGLVLHHRLQNSLKWSGSGDFARELEIYEEAIEPGVRAVHLQQRGEEFDEQDFNLLIAFLSRYRFMSNIAYPLMVPPLEPVKAREGWENIGASLMESARGRELHPAVKQFAAMSSAFKQGRPEDFNQAVLEHRQWIERKGLVPELKKGSREHFFNQFSPFYKSMGIYVLAFILAAASWLNWSQWLNRSAFRLIFLAFLVHTFGLVTRMVLEGRPPVTNLYSSAVFVGWGAVGLGLILERIFRDGIGSVVAASVGFSTLLVAHFLSLDGDTMIMLQAVLDTNFWLATHVVVITLGYAATFVAGFLAIIYIFRGFFTRSLKDQTARALSRMVYGIICFATLFSFVGTILGGIWADQSWGRFWGWDPKENGALIIVLWNAVILHARWGGLIRERGLMNMAVFGNIVTGFSWFGTNMLGVGLHAYGFMDKAFFWLLTFWVSQLVIIGIGLLPARLWASFKGNSTGPTAAKASDSLATRT